MEPSSQRPAHIPAAPTGLNHPEAAGTTNRKIGTSNNPYPVIFGSQITNIGAIKSPRGEADPTMDPSLAKQLRLICPENSKADAPVSLDQNLTSTFVFDNSFYNQTKNHRGILAIDQALALDPLTSNIVANLSTGNDFRARFGQAMVNLGAVVLNDKKSEIRKSYRAVKNKPRSSFGLLG
ncbi:peroxidase 60-like [Hibiscus syriacus]|uniref:peroxidase 60-like n=1 Tax=Hibiscus syriacus TaxID=106335 RepID=UPI0019233116|nr:peroxidase 60-like [Hibiscus syriacus]